MSAYSEELKKKNNDELIKLITSEAEFSPSYNKAVRKELQSRGINVEKLDLPLLSIDMRRKICESCQNHTNKIPTNFESDAICGLTMRDPVFKGSVCENYASIPAFRGVLLRRALISLVMGILVLIVGAFAFWEDLLEGVIYRRNVVAIIVGPIGIIGAIVYFIKMIRFKYPKK